MIIIGIAAVNDGRRENVGEARKLYGIKLVLA
jgi:hypothetical protein